jgi:mannose-6-phosphate isomerase-like protein (cupin superfamily)
MSYPPARHLDAAGQVSATLRTADARPDLVIGARTQVHHLATGASTDGQFGLYRWDMAAHPKGGPSGHFHRTMSESFFVLDGTVSLYNGDAWVDATSGDFLYVPPGGIHAFSNNSGAPASMLILFAPGAPREAYFASLAEIAASGRQLTDEEWLELWARHDQFPAKI